MGAELGATCSLFPYDERMAKYLQATTRAELATIANDNKDILSADAEVIASPSTHYKAVHH